MLINDLILSEVIDGYEELLALLSSRKISTYGELREYGIERLGRELELSQAVELSTLLLQLIKHLKDRRDANRG